MYYFFLHGLYPDSVCSLPDRSQWIKNYTAKYNFNVFPINPHSNSQMTWLKNTNKKEYTITLESELDSIILTAHGISHDS